MTGGYSSQLRPSKIGSKDIYHRDYFSKDHTNYDVLSRLLSDAEKRKEKR